ncbi:aldose 1-epimerase family protein [Croceibacterium ferulae]|uniref:aldose 1-epimerase family protein n=1 Tax=Croceibacterium ferulae TaxID=1854641 RepID=UPI000EB3BA7A|nr:aldose 1-epimerase family protein [Croceibacterium ferulae]
MVTLFGETMTRRALAERTGSLSQFAGVRLSTLGDGVERGNRLLEFRTGTGLRFTVLVDRAMDIAECEHAGRSVGWHSPSGFRHPSLHDYEGEGGLGWFRSMSGLNITCGLDHTLFMHDDPAGHYHYGPRQKVSSSLHGRIGTVPARLTGYGEHWDGDTCVLWAEGVVQQSTVFGEDLHLIRRIEADVGGDAIRLHDRVVNHGFYRTPHMYCYHINVGHPVLAEGARYVAPIRKVLWAAHADDYQGQGVGYRTAPAPIRNFHEQVWQHDMAADAQGRVNVALVNEAIGFGFEVETLKSQFPAMYQWQNFHAGHYAMGIEPSTNHVLGKEFARERGELIWLEHGEERQYDTVLRILPNGAAVTDAVARIEAVQRQPDEDYPQPTGDFPDIAGHAS